MALPLSYTTPTAYFTAAVEFLSAHAWIYQEANTCFMKTRILNNMPMDMKDYFLQITNDELNQFPFVHEDMPKSYKQTSTIAEFRNKLAELIPSATFEEFQWAEATELVTKKHQKIQYRMSRKKNHEITELASLIQSTCADTPVLIDFGAGLGYLSEKLFKLNKNFLILGLEFDAYRVQAARDRCQINCPESIKSISYEQLFITEDSRENIESKVTKLATQRGMETNVLPQLLPKMSIIGLHACADLSISSIKLFFSMPQVRRLVIMPCCYHKLKVNHETTGFTNFPLSAALKDVVAARVGNDAQSYFNRPFLRLACQQTSSRWRDMDAKEHMMHGRQMLLRALAEAVIDNDGNEFVVKLKTQSTPIPVAVVNTNIAATMTFADVRQSYVLHSKLLPMEPLQWQQKHEALFNQINAEWKGDLGPRLAEALTCLQTAMQKLCENILLYDRLCYMMECAKSTSHLSLNVCYKKLLDEKLSPRCHVLLAEKLS